MPVDGPVVRRALVPGALLTAGAAAWWILWRFDPRTAGFFPACPFHAATGFYCPGCGSTRALHALAHLDPAAAFRFNPLATVMLPLLGALILVQVLAPFSSPWRHWQNAVPARWIWGFFAVVITFWITRNIPLYPCTLLAPH